MLGQGSACAQRAVPKECMSPKTYPYLTKVIRGAFSSGGKLPASKKAKELGGRTGVEPLRVGDRPDVGEASEPSSDDNGDGLHIGKRTLSNWA